MAEREVGNGANTAMLTTRDLLLRIDAKLDVFDGRLNAVENRVSVLETRARQAEQARQLAVAVWAIAVTAGMGLLGQALDVALALRPH